MVATHTTMQYGHNAPMRYRLWWISQCTNPAPASVPSVIPTQYHRGSATLVTANTPVTVTTANAPIPISELGKPSADACGVVITEPHDTIGLRLHDGTYAGSSRSSIFSTVSVAEAINPITPAISIHHALALGRADCASGDGVESSSGPSDLADTVAVTTPLGSQPSRFRAHPRRSL